MLAISWQEFHADARRLAELLRPQVNIKFNAIYGIPRGGLVLAAYLSHTLGLPIYLRYLHSDAQLSKGVLIVDDNVITGESLEPYVEREYTTAALIVNPLARVVPSYFVRTSPDWPIFPWEIDSCAQVSA